MIVYGTKIKSDIEFSLDFNQMTQTRYDIELSSNVPNDLIQALKCGFPFYKAHGRKVYLYSDREFNIPEAGQPWCYEVYDILKFYWFSGEKTIYYEYDKLGDENLLSFWFTHLFFPLYLTLEKMYDFLHAGAVEVEGKPILFIAPSMGGKSTMTDYFLKQGHTLISDDKVATFIRNDMFMVVGSHPYHRPYRKYEELGYRVENFSKSFKPLHAFYVLMRVDGDQNVSIEEVNGFSKFDLLLPNYLYMFSWFKVERLQYLSKMMNTVRVFQVEVPWDMKKIGEVYDAIYDHSRSLR